MTIQESSKTNKMTIEKALLQFEPEKENLLPAIKKIQDEFGFVSKESIEACADYFYIKPSAVYSAASFYDQINFQKPASIIIQVCDGANCSIKKAEAVIEEIEKFTGIKVGDEFDQNIRIKRESCFGLCTQGPIMKVNGVIFEKVDPKKVDDILRSYFEPNRTQIL